MAFFVSRYKPRNKFEASSNDCSAFLFHGEILIGADGNWSAEQSISGVHQGAVERLPRWKVSKEGQDFH